MYKAQGYAIYLEKKSYACETPYIAKCLVQETTAL